MWFLVSHKRPELCKRALMRICEVGCETPGAVIVNGSAEGYKDFPLPKGWKVHYLPENIGFCGALNWAFEKYPNEPFYGIIGDDELVESPGWDKKLIAAAGDWCIANSNDRWQSERRIHGYTAFGGELIRTVGYIAPAGMWHWYVDDVWESIARPLMLRRFCRDVLTEQLHYLTGKSPRDSTYESGEKNAIQDAEIYAAWKANECDKIINLIGARMQQDSEVTATPERREAMVSINICCNRPAPPMFLTCMCYLINFITSQGLKFRLNVRMQSSNLPNSRQQAVDEALQDGSTHILFIDDDMVFPMDMLHRMIMALNELTLRGIKGAIGVNATRKSMNSLLYTAKGMDDKWMQSRGKTGVEEALKCGLGVFLVETNAIRDIPWPLFESIANHEKKEIRGEDFYLSNKLREHGIRIFIEQDVSQQIGHIGDFIYCYDTYPMDDDGQKT